jgi:hypothetical protein
MLSRRQFMTATTAFFASGVVPHKLRSSPESAEVNDVHAQLNPTRVSEILQPRSPQDVREIIRTAQNARLSHLRRASHGRAELL